MVLVPILGGGDGVEGVLLGRGVCGGRLLRVRGQGSGLVQGLGFLLPSGTLHRGYLHGEDGGLRLLLRHKHVATASGHGLSPLPWALRVHRVDTSCRLSLGTGMGRKCIEVEPHARK